MRAYAPSMSTRPILAFVLTIAVLFASAFSGVAAASAATPMHDMEMMEMGHCSSMPSQHDGKGMTKQCCISMCMAVAIQPSAPLMEEISQKALTLFAIPSFLAGSPGELATPPPKLS